MRISLVAVGRKMPAWVNEACGEYSRRLPREWHFDLIEINAGPRGKHPDVARAIEEEGRRMLTSVSAQSRVIALDEHGRQWSTVQLADQARDWMRQASDVALLIGGADGLAPACRERADRTWSLSKLTLPHGLARVVVIEQLYRAWSIIAGHPYHRA